MPNRPAEPDYDYHYDSPRSEFNIERLTSKIEFGPVASLQTSVLMSEKFLFQANILEKGTL